MGVLVVRVAGGRWALWRGRLSSEFRIDPDVSDPLVWFVKDLDYRDILGTFSRRIDAIKCIESAAGQSVNHLI